MTTARSRPRPVEAALAYAHRGWAVFPCHHPVPSGCSCRSPECASAAKHPRTRRGLHDATIHPEVIARWWSAWPQANVAIRTGAGRPAGARGVVVLDVDPLHGGDASLDRLVAAHGPLPATRLVRTGNDGVHLYFAHPGETVPNSAGTRLGPGLDVRGDGGYVIAPPSVHASGVTYRWGTIRDLAPLPPWLADLLVAPKHERRPGPDPTQLRRDAGVSAWAATAVEGELARVARAEVGRRNQMLNRAAFVLGQIVGGGYLDRAVVASLLEQAGVAVGLGARETAQTVESGLGAGETNPRHPPDRPTSRRVSTPTGGRPPSRSMAAATGRTVSEGSDVDLRNIELPHRSPLAPPPSASVDMTRGLGPSQ